MVLSGDGDGRDGGDHGDGGTSSIQYLRQMLSGMLAELLGMAWEVAAFSPGLFCHCVQLYRNLLFPLVL